jgi:hypothetical protein
MRSALEVLNSLKEISKSDDISTLGTLKSKLMIHVKATLPAAGLGSPFVINSEFDYISSGSRRISTDEWSAQAMLTAAKTHLYVNSVANYANKKPVTLFALADKARAILSQKPQSEMDAFLGFDTNIRSRHRKEFVAYVNSLFADCKKIFRVTQDRKSLNNLPSWYMTNAGVSDDIIKAAIESVKSENIGAWDIAKKDLRL